MALKCASSSDLHSGQSEKTHELHQEFFKKLLKENIDVLFLAGDLISNKQESLESFFKLLRSILPTVKVITVLGNHDFWENGYYLSSKEYTDNAPMYSPFSVYKNRKYKRRPVSWGEMLENHKKIFSKYNIIHLNGESHDLSDHTTVIGFDGWYNNVDLKTLGSNDYLFLPENIESAPVMSYLRNKAEKDLEKILNIDTDGKTIIGITHFPPFTQDKPIVNFEVHEEWGANPKFLEFLTDKCDFLLVGHNHQETDVCYNNCRILNSGAPYDESKRSYLPQYKIFSVE
jgi:predicted phosphodiesterase